MDKAIIPNVDAYIAQFLEPVQQMLQLMRETIKQNAPRAIETISYQMPAFKQNGVLVYFAGYKNHIGFYPTGSGIKAFQKEISDYKNSKGTVQFPLDKPLPIDLIAKMVVYRVNENSMKVKKKK